jgi:hypothetical protein
VTCFKYDLTGLEIEAESFDVSLPLEVEAEGGFSAAATRGYGNLDGRTLAVEDGTILWEDTAETGRCAAGGIPM